MVADINLEGASAACAHECVERAESLDLCADRIGNRDIAETPIAKWRKFPLIFVFISLLAVLYIPPFMNGKP